MPFTYTWASAITLVSKMVKGIPTSTIDAQVCDMVSGEMYGYFPWSWTVTSGTLCTLTTGNQDFSPAANIYRLLRARMVCTSLTPDSYNELQVRQTLPPDLTPCSYTNIGCLSYEEGIGLVRLQQAVQIPTGTTLTIQGDWQTNPTKITATSQGLWFPDEYLSVACEGLLYWYYRLADDPRAGTKSASTPGNVASGTGQYGAFMAALHEMAAKEDYLAVMCMMPDDPIGVGRSTGSINLWGQ